MELVVHEEADEVVDNFLVAALAGGLHGVLVELVALADVDRLRELAVLLEEPGAHTAHLEQVVLAKGLCKLVLVNRVVLLKRRTQLLVVLLLNVEVVQCLVHTRHIALLHALEVGTDRGDVVAAALYTHLTHDTLGVDTLDDGGEQVVDKVGVLLQVEAHCVVAELEGGHLVDGVLEHLVVPRQHGVVHHHARRGVPLLVLAVDVADLCPVVVLLADDNDLVAVETRLPELDVLHQLVAFVLRVQHGEVREHADVRALAVQPLLEESNQLLNTATRLEEVDELVQLVSHDDDVLRCDGGHAELLCVHACVADLGGGGCGDVQ